MSTDFKTAMIEASRLLLVKREHQKRTAAIDEAMRYWEDRVADSDAEIREFAERLERKEVD